MTALLGISALNSRDMPDHYTAISITSALTIAEMGRSMLEKKLRRAQKMNWVTGADPDEGGWLG